MCPSNVVLIIAIIATTHAMFEGQNTIRIDLDESTCKKTVDSGGWLTPTVGIRYYCQAPDGYVISIHAIVNFSPYYVKSSYHDSVGVCGDGNLDPNAAETYYGSSDMTKTSIFNNLLMYIKSNDSYVRYTFEVNLISVGRDCGWTMSPKITGGNCVPPNKYTSMTLFQLDGETYCGVSPRWVLSAGHCFYHLKDYSAMQVICGVSNLTSREHSGYRQQSKILKVIIHPHYNDDTLHNDIALARLASELIWSSFVGPACLPFLYLFGSYDDYCVYVTGFGTTSFAGARSDVLLEGCVKVINNSRCEEDYPDLDDNQMCVFPNGPPNRQNYHPDACQMDSGGPLYWIKDGRNCFVIGLVCKGRFCGSLFPSVYTRLTCFCDWICQETKETFCRK